MPSLAEQKKKEFQLEHKIRLAPFWGSRKGNYNPNQ